MQLQASAGGGSLGRRRGAGVVEGGGSRPGEGGVREMVEKYGRKTTGRGSWSRSTGEERDMGSDRCRRRDGSGRRALGTGQGWEIATYGPSNYKECLL